MSQKCKKVAVFGSTGSIGRNSLAVIESLAGRFETVLASGHDNWNVLAQQARQYHIPRLILTENRHFGHLQQALAGEPVEIQTGSAALVEAAADPEIDIIIVAVVGAAALPAVLAAAKAGKTIAIANKESLVVAGCLLLPLAAQYGATILPVDSEHSAILQAMHSGQREEVEKVIITASGGPFRRATPAQLAQVTLAEALNHPTWAMGPKISIDSATMMNKALEIIEARWLFDLPDQQIEVLVHPESIIHSLVEFKDGSVIAQLSEPDMKLPIQYALTFPERLAGLAKRLNLNKIKELHFEPPDFERFPALRLGFEVARRGGSAGAVFNAANEAAVAAFRQGRIGFTRIVELVEACLRKHDWLELPALDELLAADRWARAQVNELLPESSQAPALKSR